jgi:glycosyltransferase involved in cell wall biosynthesis
MKALKVAVLCDYAEENWPSMDLSATMLLNHLNLADPAELRAERIQPRMKHPFQSACGHVQSACGHSRSACGQPGFNADRLFNRFWCYPQVAGKLKHFDLFHVVDHSYAQLVHRLAPERTIVTCHDLDTFRCLLQPRVERRPYWFRSMARQTLRGLRKAAAIVCVSHATRAQVLKFDLAAAERVHVVPNGVHPKYSSEPDTAADALAEQILGPVGATLDLLHVGSTIPRKRIDILLRVFAACSARRPHLRLVRVGAPFTDAQKALARDLQVENSILCLPFLGEDVLAAVYRRAAVVLIPSESEGFGLPLAESMACGTVVVASNIPALQEVSGGNAVLCAVGAVDEWTDAVLSLLQQREVSAPAWSRLIDGGCVRARAFSWQQNATAMVDIYRSILSRTKQD